MAKSIAPVIIVLLFLLCFTLTAQDREFVHGKLVDTETGEPIVFATVQIKGKSQGVITNMDGGFRIPIQFRAAGDTLQISSLGYKKADFSLLRLSPTDINIIRLEPGALLLEEAVVSAKKKRKLSAKEIVALAIKAIPQNYPLKSFSTLGYYRDYQFKDDTYWNLNEAILEVFDYGFNELDDETTQVKIHQYGLNPNFPEDSLARQAYNYETNEKIIDNAHIESFGGNEFSILRIHDAIRNFNTGTYDFVGTMKTDFIKNHVFKKLKDTYMDGGQLHTIAFKSQPPGYLAEGTMYISQTNYAIYKMQYKLYETSLKGKETFGSTKVTEGRPIFSVEVEYEPIEDKMFLNFISFNNEFQLNRPPKFLIKDILADAPGGFFSVAFNRPIAINSAKELANYHIRFKGETMDIDKVQVYQDSVRVFPKLKKGSLNMMSALDVASKRGKFSKELIEIQIKNIQDLEGNVLNENNKQIYKQFREYFVQRVKPNSRAPFDEVYMTKGRPLFMSPSKANARTIKEFWSNTPLQLKIN